MKIGIQAWGTRGDINPMLALAQGLHKSGHDVLFYYTCFTGVDFSNFSLPGLEVKSTIDLSDKPKLTVPFRKVYDMEISEGGDYILKEVYGLFDEEICKACENIGSSCDLMIASNLIYQASCFAEKSNIPFFTVHVDSNYLDKGMIQDRIDQDLNKVYLERVNTLRKKLGLKEAENARQQSLCSPYLNLMTYSKVFEEGETSMLSPCAVTGFLDLDTTEGAGISEDLNSFLNNGSPPVFFSLGSLSFFEEDLKDILNVFVKSISISGCRAIIQGDWGNYAYQFPEELPIYKVNFVPHNLVFPHCLCVVHHGGAGTTHSTLLNGCPSIVIAYAWDQFNWGNRLARLGASPGLLQRRTIDEIQLAGSIRNVMVNKNYKEKAELLRVKTKRENGVKKAVKLIEEHISSFIQVE